MLKEVQEAAEMIQDHQHDFVQIISHMDADGVSAAALTSVALQRMNIKHQVKFVRMLYRDVVESLDVADLTIFTDLGSSQCNVLKDKFSSHDVIIADHHKPDDNSGWPGLVHLNAHLAGYDGVGEISGAGMAYLIAREIDQENRDLAATAIVGAIGDVQDAWGKLKGKNRDILEEGVEAGVLSCNMDLLLYGRNTRPLFRSLEILTDPPIPGVSNTMNGCVSMLNDLGISYKNNGTLRKLADLTDDEKRRLSTELITRAMTDVPDEFVKYVPGLIVGEVYTLLKEKENSMLRGADEFSTCINATARNEQPLIGLEVARGDRRVYYGAMLKLLKHHRRNIAKGMEFIRKNGLEKGPEGYLQYFDATGSLKETFVGTVAGLTLGNEGCDPYKPIAGIVRTNGVAKVSARCSKLLFLSGIDLARAIRQAARSVGGEGGGHAVACGAQVEEDQVPVFVQAFEHELLKQS